MITVTMFRNSDQVFTGFQAEGHAGYEDYGSDIVCAAVSVLTINAVNSIEALTEDSFQVKNREDGFLYLRLDDGFGEKSELLLNSLYLGLQDVESSYGNEFIRLMLKEV
ncbi:ribosomal-processing cysteine protease Prp [Anaerolentibacter hominis]|uniref:ribosomal-processing cysteine protease Prp n=1 Tax=Anaerolentibacter hominis TaxID=3079009 RepID=UPI0031B818BC